MTPDDPRHGQRRGYYAHRADGEPACEPCKRAAAAAEARYELARMHGKPGRVPAIGTMRRLRALQAIGWTLTAIADHIGTKRSRVEKWCNQSRVNVYTTTAVRVAEVYEELCMTMPTGRWATRTRNTAIRRGYLPPLAWTDIDDPNERPNLVEGRRTDAETVAEWDHFRAAGYSIHSCANALGVKPTAIEKAIERNREAA